MSDLIINTGLEEDYVKGVSLTQVSSISATERERSTSSVLQPRKQQDTVVTKHNGHISNSSVSGASDRYSSSTDTPGQHEKPFSEPPQNDPSPQLIAAQETRATRIRTPVETYGHCHLPVVAFTSTSLSPLSEPFFPRQTPRRSSDIYDIVNTDGNPAADCVPQDYFLYNSFLPSNSSDSSIAVSSAAEDGQIFADDDYKYEGSLKGEQTRQQPMVPD